MSTNPAGPAAKVISCPACGGTITLRALGQSVMTACPSCGTQIDVSQPQFRLIQKYRRQQQELLIPLGTRGTLQGKPYEVIGALRRSDSAGQWDEYLLFNPYVGFRWLVHDTGHWSFGQMLKDTSRLVSTLGLYFDGHALRKYHHGTPEVTWVVGEFYWRVAVGDKVYATDYMGPPWMLSCEKSDGEVTWTALEYVEPEEVEAAFQISSPERRWLAGNQPNPAVVKWRAIRPITLAALAAVFVVQIGTAIHARNKTMPVGTYDLAQAQGEGHVYGPFTFDAPGSMNELTASAPLENSWVELQCSLVNVATGTSIDFTNELSYYSGIDSDGGWTEGSRQNVAELTGVPAGTYKLIVAGAGSDQAGKPLGTSVFLSLRHDVVPWQNFWLAVTAILLYPGYLLYRRHVIEKERWSEADESL